MESTKHNLSQEIKATLEAFTEGSISFPETKERYKQFLDLLQQNDISSKQAPSSSLSALCYVNCAYNFSVYTAVLIVGKSKSIILGECGDQGLLENALSIINTSPEKLNAPGLQRIPSSVSIENTYPFNTFLLTRTSPNDQKYAFIGISSSVFFSDDYFQDVANSALNIIAVHNDRILDYDCSRIYKDMENCLRESINEKNVIDAHMLRFNSIDTIFAHKGIHTITDISLYITDKLNTEFGSECPIFNLSLGEYIIFKKKDRSQTQEDRIKTEFRYNDVSLPYKTSSVHLENKDSFGLLLSVLFV